jgi:hypothetical protein
LATGPDLPGGRAPEATRGPRSRHVRRGAVAARGPARARRYDSAPAAESARPPEAR